ncbi:MAG: LamG domain-containing protein, partial [Patescibacteria group bacterium]|nr:LamG domain-containing protein [Patescibacteria group bacterium]
PVFSFGHDSSGPGGTGMQFDGVDDYVDFGNSATLKPPLPITILAWVNFEQLGSYEFLFLNDEMVSSYNGFLLAKTSADQIYVNYGDGIGAGPTDRRTKVGTTTLSVETWYHVVAVIRGPSDIDLYINGVDDGGTYSGTGGSMAYTTANAKISNNINPFNGSLDDVRIYNRALSADEIRQHYNQKKPILHLKMDEGSGTTAYDESFNNNDGTIYGVQGTATGTHSTTVLQDTSKSWTADEWIGETATIYSGTCATVSQTI